MFTSRYSDHYSDVTLNWDTTYYYTLRTSDCNANHSWSNEVPITTPGGFPPEPSLIAIRIERNLNFT